MIFDQEKFVLELKERVNYDPSSKTGLRYIADKWVGKYKNVCCVKKGDEAGCRRERSWDIGFNGKLLAVHRVIWLIVHGQIPNNLVIDHIDGNPFNNNIGNLRLVSQAINSRNSKKNSLNTSGVTGVGLHLDSYWKASWYEDGKICIKYFSIKKLGDKGAFDAACLFRKLKIEELNAKGHGYTERHGSENETHLG